MPATMSALGIAPSWSSPCAIANKKSLPIYMLRVGRLGLWQIGWAMICRPFRGKIESFFQLWVGPPVRKQFGDPGRFEEMLKNCPCHLIGRNDTFSAQVPKHIFQSAQVFAGNGGIAPQHLKPTNQLKSSNRSVRSILARLKILNQTLPVVLLDCAADFLHGQRRLHAPRVLHDMDVNCAENLHRRIAQPQLYLLRRDFLCATCSVLNLADYPKFGFRHESSLD